jgi:hypothetical protein
VVAVGRQRPWNQLFGIETTHERSVPAPSRFAAALGYPTLQCGPEAFQVATLAHGPDRCDDDGMPGHAEQRVVGFPSGRQTLRHGPRRQERCGHAGRPKGLDGLGEQRQLLHGEVSPRCDFLLVGRAGSPRFGGKVRAEGVDQVEGVGEQRAQQGVGDRQDQVGVGADVAGHVVGASSLHGRKPGV